MRFGQWPRKPEQVIRDPAEVAGHLVELVFESVQAAAERHEDHTGALRIRPRHSPAEQEHGRTGSFLFDAFHVGHVWLVLELHIVALSAPGQSGLVSGGEGSEAIKVVNPLLDRNEGRPVQPQALARNQRRIVPLRFFCCVLISCDVDTFSIAGMGRNFGKHVGLRKGSRSSGLQCRVYSLFLLRR